MDDEPASYQRVHVPPVQISAAQAWRDYSLGGEGGVRTEQREQRVDGFTSPSVSDVSEVVEVRDKACQWEDPEPSVLQETVQHLVEDLERVGEEAVEELLHEAPLIQDLTDQGPPTQAGGADPHKQVEFADRQALDEAFDEEDPFLSRDEKSQEEYRKRKEIRDATMRALLAHSRLRSIVVSMLLCIIAFVLLQWARVEVPDGKAWPLFIDFVPLWILPCLVYVAAVDFSSARVTIDAPRGKCLIVCAGFVVAIMVLALEALIYLRLEGMQSLPWTLVLCPVWVLLAFSQILFCFMVPGYLRTRRLKGLYVMVFSTWAAAMSVVLTALKLDGEIDLAWHFVFLPFEAAQLVQLLLLNGQRCLDRSCRVALLFAMMAVACRLDGIFELPWATGFVPIVFVLLANIAMLVEGRNDDL